MVGQGFSPGIRQAQTPRPLGPEVLLFHLAPHFHRFPNAFYAASVINLSFNPSSPGKIETFTLVKSAIR
jgi:hypothetical protein